MGLAMAFEIINEYLKGLRGKQKPRTSTKVTGTVEIDGESIAIVVDTLSKAKRIQRAALNSAFDSLVQVAENNLHLLASICCHKESYELLRAAYQRQDEEKQLQAFEESRQNRQENLAKLRAQYGELSRKVDNLSTAFNKCRADCRGNNDDTLRQKLETARIPYEKKRTKLEKLSSQITKLTEELTTNTTTAPLQKREYNISKQIEDALKYIGIALKNGLTQEQEAILANDLKQLLNNFSNELIALDENIKQAIFKLKDRLHLQDIIEKLFPPSKFEAKKKRSSTKTTDPFDESPQTEEITNPFCELPITTAATIALTGISAGTSICTMFSRNKFRDKRDRNDLFNDALIKIQEKKFKSAKKLLLNAEYKGLKEPELYFWLGYLTWIDGDKVLAENYFAKAIALEPGHNFANLYLSYIHDDLKKYQLYKDFLQNQYHIVIDDTNFQPIPNPNYYRTMAFWLIQVPLKPENKPARVKALHYLQIALKFEPNNSQINFMTASVLLQLNRAEESIHYYEAALRHSTMTAEKTGIYNELIHAHFELPEKNISLIRLKNNYLKISELLKQFELEIQEAHFDEEHPLFVKLKEYKFQLAKLFEKLKESTVATEAELIIKLQSGNQKLNKTKSLLAVAADFAECQELLNQLVAVLEVPELNDKHTTEIAKFKSNIDDVYNNLILEVDNYLAAAREAESDNMLPHIIKAKELLFAAKKIKISDESLFSESVIRMLEASYLQNQGNYLKASSYYSQAINLLNTISKSYEKQMPNIFYYRGICHFELNQDEQAKYCFTIAYKIGDPEIKKLASNFLKMIPEPKEESPPPKLKTTKTVPVEQNAVAAKTVSNAIAATTFSNSTIALATTPLITNSTTHHAMDNLTATNVTCTANIPDSLVQAGTNSVMVSSKNAASAAGLNGTLLLGCVALYLLFGKSGTNIGNSPIVATPGLIPENHTDTKRERHKTQTGGRAAYSSPASRGR